MVEEERRGFVFNTSEGDLDMSIDEVIELAGRGDPDGLYALGMAYLFGWDVEEDQEKGYLYLERAISAGQTEAMTLAVRLFMQGEYQGIGPERAAELAIEAARDGIPDAQLYAGLAYMDGVSVPQDYAEAARLFRLSANQGNSEARTNLAYMFQEGLGVEKDESKAFKLYRAAANAGNVNAMFHLAVCYEFGVGARKDVMSAAEWYGKGSDQGDAFATERLGFLWSEGFGGNGPDASKAFELFLKAAMEGVTTAMATVGRCYMDGYGTEKDAGEAAKWLRMAADNGDADASDLLSSLGKQA
ncbi:MAG: sel1 repeat family protein [Candidatus Methanomethylophilaceae archaeon]|nr:sel1 repeat family protein [Candidatus Methanomethylophilaceae archaeon]